MVRLTAATVRGYLLEEVLAYLIRRSGYSLLVAAIQDSDALASRGNGLVVKGRGGDHQVDALGELDWVPAFTFPLRLFLEAKFRNARTGIGVVRNAVGVLDDLNQRFAAGSAGLLMRRYRYAYALFSTSGYSKPAVYMALAHEISLVDLSGVDYRPIRNAITAGAAALLQVVPIPDTRSADEDEDDEAGPPPIVKSIRSVMREALDTNPLGPEGLDAAATNLAPSLSGVVSAAKDLGDLFVGMAAGPHMLMIRASDRNAFLSRMRSDPTLKVRIGWHTEEEGGRRWVMTPVEGGIQFELSFSVPSLIGDWIFSSEGGSKSKALRFKRELLPHIFIPFKDEDGANHLFRLDYTETEPAD